MKKKELIEKLNQLPDDATIWLGVESEEGGYLPLKDVFCASAADLPLNHDGISQHERIYINRGDSYTSMAGDVIEDLGDDEFRINRLIIVLGRQGSEREAINRENEREKPVDQNRLEENYKEALKKLNEASAVLLEAQELLNKE